MLWAKKLMKLGITMLSMAMPVVPAYGVSAAANTEGVALKGKYEEKYFAYTCCIYYIECLLIFRFLLTALICQAVCNVYWRCHWLLRVYWG